MEAHYVVLGLSPGAGREAVKKAFRDAARTSHPDRGGDPTAWAALREAYEAVLPVELDAPQQADVREGDACTVVAGPFAGCRVKVLSSTEASLKVEFVATDDAASPSGAAPGSTRFLKRELVTLGDAPARTGEVSPASTSGSTGAQQQSPAASHSHRVAFSRVVIRAAPALDAPVMGVAHQGQTLHAVDERNGWISIGDNQWLLLMHPQHGVLLERIPAAAPAAPAAASAEPQEATAASHELGALFLPGKLPNFFVGLHERCFPPCADSVLAEASLGLLTNAVDKVLEAMRERHRAAEMNSAVDELYREGDVATDDSGGIPKVTWTGLDSFPFNEPLKFLFVCDWLDSPTGMPMAFAEEGDGLHAWRPSDKRQAWDRSRSLEEMVPDDDLCSRDAYEYASKLLPALGCVMRSDAYGNIVSPFAAAGAPGDFRFEGFAPRSRVGAVADHPDNCVVTCARLWAWKGALLPHFIAPEHLLCGFTAFKLRKALNLIKTTSEAGPNVVEAVLGFVPSGNPDQLRLRDDLADPLQGFPDRESLAGYLCTLHELAEPQHRRMGGWGETPSLVRAVKWFDDDSPRGEYVRYQHCSLCDGEQPFYNLPLGYRAEEAPAKCMGYLCDNCAFLRFSFFLAELEADTLLECRTGKLRDRRRWAAQSAAYAASRKAAAAAEREMSRLMNPRLEVERAQAEDMVSQLRAAGRAGDAAELERQLRDDDTDSEPEMLEVF